MKIKFTTILLVLAVCATVYAVISNPASTTGPVITPAYAQVEATAQAGTINGSPIGDVLVGDTIVFRLRTPAGGLSPYERAQQVAGRLNLMLNNSLQPSDIRTGRVNGQQVVMAKGEVLVTADQEHARINGTTPRGLANQWALRLENSVSARQIQDTPTSQKVVPIISVGSGLRVGGALVTGSQSSLRQVVAVAQVEGQFGNAVRVRALIPVSTENVIQNIRRVPQTSVIGLVDIPL